MDMVERVARAIDDASKNARIGQSWEWFAPEAKAAIRAMLEGQEPVAWRYGDGEGSWELISDTASPFAISLVSQGYSGTPLYDLSAIKEAVK